MQKKHTYLVLMVLEMILTLSVVAQTSGQMSYQVVIHDASGNLVVSRPVGMQISIVQEDLFGASVYVETQIVSTNANGLVHIGIGSDSATVLKGDLTSIDWLDGPYFMKTEIDPEGGVDYTITDTDQMLSVPYAMYAKTTDSVRGGIAETDPSVPLGSRTGEIQYWNGSEWATVAPGLDGSTFTLVNGIPTWVETIVPAVPAVTNPITGKTWMDRNLGASRVAISSTDASAYGDLYQWGRGTDGHEKRTSGTTSYLSSSDTPGHGDFITNDSPSSPDWRSPQNDNLWQGLNGTNNPCPSGYRLPTEAEWAAERTSWSSNNTAGAFASPLKLPVAGDRNSSNGALFAVDGRGYYWSSTVNDTDSRSLFFGIFSAHMNNTPRAYGRSVRCLKNWP